jgi:DNA topoisomerase-2
MKKSTKSIEEIYQKKTPIEHILTRPDTYIGDITEQNELMWVFDNESKQIKEKEIKYVPGLYKIFDEIIVNAGDRIQEDNTCDIIKVNIDKENNIISVYNNGIGIDIVKHKEHDLYIPSLIFGELLTSTNYDDTKKRTTGGRNGYGAKLTNIYSTFFSVTTIDSSRNLHFYQEFKNNMYDKLEPIIKSIDPKTKSFTQITFQPDLKRFGLTTLTDDIISLFIKRVYDLAGIYNKITVYYNDKKISFNNFKKYIEMYNLNIESSNNNENCENGENNDNCENGETDKNCEKEIKTKNTVDIMFEESERWKIGVIYAPNNDFKHISFVNGICTYHGGSHVDYILNMIIEKVKMAITKKHKDLVIKQSTIKENLIVFINCIIENPAFTSQVKETLKTKPLEFGSSCELSDKYIKKICSSGLIDQVINLVKMKEQSLLKKTDGKKTSTIKGIPKLEDANFAGTRKSLQCKLILTEGDSAKAFALAGRSVVGSELYGVFPLRGKLLNVREAKPSQIMNNEEIKNIKKIMGLQQGKEYKDMSELRYGGIIILTDQDTDGFHIKGLLINFIHYFWPSLVTKDFIFALQTPIVKAIKGSIIKSFYNLSDYEMWKKEPNSHTFRIKYYKGLGTSTKEEAKEYFEDLEEKLIKYSYINNSGLQDNIYIPDETECFKTETETEKNINKSKKVVTLDDEDSEEIIIEKEIKPKYKDDTTEAITLAFEKDRSHDRKIWLMNYNRDNIIKDDIKNVTIPTFINKELIHFSNDDCLRSIASVCDGLKPSQRKVLYGTILKKLNDIKDEIRVSQLASFVSEKTCYHHGESSVIGTIVNMAQNFVGTNNINILFPSGQFGTRLMGGEDSASARYIHTFLTSITRVIFRQEDDAILNYLDDDGVKIEPEWYIPIIPLVLVNGCKGIGSGFSTKIPQYNPLDIIENLKLLMEEKELKEMIPWYKGFTGTILRSVNKAGDFLIYGKYQKIDQGILKITELPIGTWTTPYKDFLDSEIDKKNIISYTSNITDELFEFTVTLDEDKLDKIIENKLVYQKFKLVSRLGTTNMHLYNTLGVITRYETSNDIIKEFYNTRLQMYIKRKKYLINKINNELNILEWKMKFINNVLENKIIVFKQKRENIIKRVQELGFPELATENNNESYDYITTLPLFSLTEEKVQELQNKLDNKILELEKIKSTTEIEQWKHELQELEIKYQEFIKVPEQILKPKVKKGKK